MKKLMVFLLSMICVLGFAGCRKKDIFDIKIYVPAGSTEEFVFSHEEISPKGKKLKYPVAKDLAILPLY